MVVSTDKVYHVSVGKPARTADLTWMGAGRFNEDLGCEEFLMEDQDGWAIAVPAFVLETATESPKP